MHMIKMTHVFFTTLKENGYLYIIFIFKVPIDTTSTSTTWYYLLPVPGTVHTTTRICTQNVCTLYKLVLVILPTLIPHNPIIWIFLSFSLWSLVQRYWTYWTAVEEALCVGVQWPANLQVANPSQSPTLGPKPNVGL